MLVCECERRVSSCSPGGARGARRYRRPARCPPISSLRTAGLRCAVESPRRRPFRPARWGSEWCRTMSRGVIARESELGAIAGFLERVGGGPAALLLAGEAGMGKSLLWDHGVDEARRRGAVVLSCRAVEAEASISFAGLSDLLAGVDESALTSLRAPRKHALGVALLLEDPGSQPPDQRAVSLALLDILRALARPTAGETVPVPRDLTELRAGRLGRLPGWTRELLLAIAASPRPTVEVLEAALADEGRVHEGLERAADSGVLELDGSLVRFVHPLLASVCYQAAPLWHRRAVHRLLAGAVSEPEERARHLALAAQGPDAAVASDLDGAGARAAMRGATAAAGELYELAADATPSESAARQRARRLRAATLHRLAGDRERAITILQRLLGEAAPGRERADVLFALAEARPGDLRTITRLGEEALAEAAGDDRRRARILAFLSWMRLLVGDVSGALGAARDGLRSAERIGDPALLAPAIARVAMAELWALDITPGLVERGVELEERLSVPLEFHERPTIALARRLICVSDLERARGLLEVAATHAGDRGDEATRGHVLFHLVMLEWFAGRWERALEHAGAALDLAQPLGDDQFRGMVLHARALVEAHRGDVEAARTAAAEAASIAAATADVIFPIWNEAVLGHLELALGDAQAAAGHLRALPYRLISLGWNDPADSLWPDAIEALVDLGELEEAGRYLESYETLAQRSSSVWALATAARCRGLLAAANGDFDAAFDAFDRALAQHDRMPGRFERGRTLLSYGTARRRARERGAARRALEAALEIFEEQGAELWARRAADELRRISGRRPAGAELTETELRVARLAAEGRANKEIAAAMFMSVHTVEAHLSRVYRKLGLRSRTGLARQAAITPEPEPKP